MTDIRSIEAGKYNQKLASELKASGDFQKPDWIDFVKSSTHKVRPIIEPDFWYKRSASILRQMYFNGVLGVGRLRSRYGGRKDNGMAPPHFKKGAGKMIRVILQQAEAAGIIEKSKGKRAGRQLTVKGKTLLESVAK